MGKASLSAPGYGLQTGKCNGTRETTFVNYCNSNTLNQAKGGSCSAKALGYDLEIEDELCIFVHGKNKDYSFRIVADTPAELLERKSLLAWNYRNKKYKEFSGYLDNLFRTISQRL